MKISDIGLCQESGRPMIVFEDNRGFDVEKMIFNHDVEDLFCISVGKTGEFVRLEFNDYTICLSAKYCLRFLDKSIQ